MEEGLILLRSIKYQNVPGSLRRTKQTSVWLPFFFFLFCVCEALCDWFQEVTEMTFNPPMYSVAVK